MSEGIKKCFEAFDRLKKGKPNIAKFNHIARSQITPSIVSQEAGFDSGYLKMSRVSHQPIISLINDYKNSHESPQEVRSRELQKAEKDRDEALMERDNMESQLHNALGRELLLVRALKECEKKVKELESKLNVISFNRGQS